MRAVVQRVKEAQVRVGGKVVGQIGPGLVVFAAVGREDTEKDFRYLAHKIATLRLFPDEAKRLSRSVQEIGGSILVISNFTLYGDCRKGRRPSFAAAASPEVAEAGFQQFVTFLRETGVPIAQGQFGATMEVTVVNDGPVTIILDT